MGTTTAKENQQHLGGLLDQQCDQPRPTKEELGFRWSGCAALRPLR
jgi:hypothetical protein